MVRPVFLLQIVKVDPPHVVARLPAGGPLERDLIHACVEAIVSKGVGYFRSEAAVREAIQSGMADVFDALKVESKQALGK